MTHNTYDNTHDQQWIASHDYSDKSILNWIIPMLALVVIGGMGYVVYMMIVTH